MTSLLLAIGLAVSGPVAPPPREPAAEVYPATPEDKARAAFDAWRADPVAFVRDHFLAEPDAWQADTLRALLVSPRIAMSACKGPGKSTVLAWAGWWILACHVGAQGSALSITGDNLKDGLWKELAFWHGKSPVLERMFDVQATRIVSKDPKLAKTWWLSFRSFAQGADPDAQASSIAGLHAPVVFYLLDEIGDMSPGVISAAKGIFATKGQRGWILAAGNPTTQDGALYWITTTDAAQWRVVHITGDPDDPKRSPRIDADWARAEIAALGRDNPWVMVNILGLFPPAGANQLISANDVTQAMARDMPAMVAAALTDARIWGLDPARSERAGADEAALVERQGPLVRTIATWRGKDGTELGDIVAQRIIEARDRGEGPDKVFVDIGGIGTSPYDRLRSLGAGFRKLVAGVDFGGCASNGARYADKRTEMWVEMAEWVARPNSILPNDATLRAELVAPRYEFRRIQKHTVFKLESKDEMRKRGVRSPNRADALALTFAAPVLPESTGRLTGLVDARPKVAHKYNPLRRS